MNFDRRKDLLGLRDVTKAEIQALLQTAIAMKYIITRDIKKVPTLQGKAIVNVFYENSTRTSTSFELAGKYLSADVINLSVAKSSVQKGESLKDTIKTIEMMGPDVLVMRHPSTGAPHYIAKNTKMHVINAGDGINEHPTQALLDMYSILQHKGTLEGLKIAIVGDILHSRVARSNIFGLKRFGCELRVIGPSTLFPSNIEKLGVKTYTDLKSGLQGVDVINVLRIQKERQANALFPSTDEYAELYMIRPEHLNLANDDAIIIHPGPMNRGIEISTDLAENPRCLVNEQVANGVAVRMAILYQMLGGGKGGIVN